MPGEAEIVGMFRRRLGIRGAPDDAEALPPRAACWCVDTLSAGTDVPPGMGLRRAARKSVVACVSDLAAKGSSPVSGLVSVSLPRGTRAAEASAVADGLADAAGEFGFSFAGGDTGQGAEASITVCLAGTPPGGGRGVGRWPGRGGARDGDLVLATGRFGLTAAGRDLVLGGAGARGRFGRAAVAAVHNPVCRLRFGTAAAGMFTSSTDTSDGLAAALGELAQRSGAALFVRAIPGAEGLEEFAARRGADARALALGGGEEYEIVFTARPSDRGRIAEAGRRTGTPVTEIGVVEKAGSGGRGKAGAYLEGRGGITRIRGGWQHFGKGGKSGGSGR